MNATYASDRQRTTGGGFIIVVISFLSAVVVLMGFWYATGTSERNKIGLAAAGCEPNLSPSGLQCTTYQTVAQQYTKITTQDIQQLNADVAAYTANEGNDLTAAETALTAEVKEANALDTSLVQFPFPPVVAPQATALMQATQASVKLIAEQARSTSLIQLQSFNNQVAAANAAVQTDMTLVGKALSKSPTAKQEP
jgi:hypothetical protein